ncbi:PAS/PAC sensor hybrid histidine kinase [Acidisphaera rubrifaciens HS-AP3]|uniref:histidine kinase n=2 Tax=Acidisphaera TaxID=50714 RepID=A0A0D6P935_9PROT|nr:PAS/PAC sensor hybrid histidine kinase [Acidisphaera rubrifaciens HS-AP3]
MCLHPDEHVDDPFLLAMGDSLTAGLVRAYDWAATALGPLRTWPQSLRTATGIVLHSPVPIVMLWGADGYMICNDAYSRFAGSRHPTLLGSRVREGWAEVADFNDHVMKVGLAGGTLAYRDQELTLWRHGVPEQVWMNLDYSPVFDEAGVPAGVIAIVVETTERVLADRHSAAEQLRLRAMFEQAPGFMALLEGPQHVFSLANSAYLRLVDQREFIGLPVRIALPELEGQGFLDLLDRCYATGEPFVGSEVKVALRSGPAGALVERFVDFVYQPIRDRNGDVTGLFLQGSDVSDRVRAAAALRESERRFREVADAAPVFIWAADASGARYWFNRPWLAFAGVDPETEVGEGWVARVHPDDRARYLAICGDARARRVPFRTDVRMRHYDGTYRVLDDTGVPRFAADGAFVGFIGYSVDVTASRRTEADLRALKNTLEARVEERTAELATANRRLIAQIEERHRVGMLLQHMQRLEAVGQITAGVAHDFNNLLTVILGSIDVIDRSLVRAGDDQRARDRLGYIKSAAERGANLIQQLLAFSRRQKPELRQLDLRDMIMGMRDLLTSSLGNGVRLETDLSAETGPVLVDPTQLELVILNLAINARDAMPEGGTLTIATSSVAVTDGRHRRGPPVGAYAVIAVIDTGCGMTPDLLARVPEPFFTTKPAGKGSGLGLAQVYDFARNAGGDVDIESSPGRGTTVRVYLPHGAVAPDARPHRAGGSARPAPSAPLGHLLLVDDDGAVRDVMAAMLEEIGCSVRTAGSGGAALDLLESSAAIDLLIVDYAMPGMNGVEVAREAAALRPALPVLFVSGYANAAGMASIDPARVVQKPFRDGDLAERVRALLQPENAL